MLLYPNQGELGLVSFFSGIMFPVYKGRLPFSFDKPGKEFPSWLSRKRTRNHGVSQVRSLTSLSGLRIWRCGALWCRLQMWLGSDVAVPVV